MPGTKVKVTKNPLHMQSGRQQDVIQSYYDIEFEDGDYDLPPGLKRACKEYAFKKQLENGYYEFDYSPDGGGVIRGHTVSKERWWHLQSAAPSVRERFNG